MHASVHTPHCPIALAVSLYMLLALAVACIPARLRTAACPNARHSPCMLTSLCSPAHNPSTTQDRSAHNGQSACRPSTEFASSQFSSNAVVHHRLGRRKHCCVFLVPRHPRLDSYTLTKHFKLSILRIHPLYFSYTYCISSLDLQYRDQDLPCPFSWHPGPFSTSRRTRIC